MSIFRWINGAAVLKLCNLMGWVLQYIDKTRIYNDFYTERAESITFSITVFRYLFSQERFLGKEIIIITNRFRRMAKPDWRSLTFDIFAIYLCISRIFFFNSYKFDYKGTYLTSLIDEVLANKEVFLSLKILSGTRTISILS